MQADKDRVSRLLKTARGQLDGILRMVEEDRYCMDISNQILATCAILGKANREVIGAHLRSCVQTAMEQGGPEKEQKIQEILDIIDKTSR